MKHNYNKWIRHPLEHLFLSPLTWSARKYIEDNSRGWLWTFRILLCALLPALVSMEVAASFSASLWLSALGLVFGTIEVIIPRNQMLVFTSAEEDKWGFGQLVPLVLLVQPLGAVCEGLWTVEGDAGG